MEVIVLAIAQMLSIGGGQPLAARLRQHGQRYREGVSRTMLSRRAHPVHEISGELHRAPGSHRVFELPDVAVTIAPDGKRNGRAAFSRADDKRHQIELRSRSARENAPPEQIEDEDDEDDVAVSQHRLL
ncbi:unnamed protein product [Lampetra planeri]